MKRRLSALLLALLPLFLSACAYALRRGHPRVCPGRELAVHFIDVGAGRFRAAAAWGARQCSSTAAMRRTAAGWSPYLEDQGVDTLDYVVCTHAHGGSCGRPVRPL